MKKLRYILKDLKWLKIYNSPFVFPKIRVYIGKTQIGVPYFLPRKWVKATPELAKKAALEEIERAEKWNAKYPDAKFKRTVRTFEEAYDDKMKNRMFPVPLTIGFSYCGLGWKTKWSEHDYRHEWDPVLSFVFFGYQIALTVIHEYNPHLWESWLYYEYATDKTKSKRERIAQCKEKAPQTWTRFKNDTKTTFDYYEHILKPKYLKK
jgi:hypothetical protein